MRGTPLAFTGCGLDRADYLRADPARLAELAGPDARLLRLDRLIPLLGEDACLQWGRCGELDKEAELVFLGPQPARLARAASLLRPLRWTDEDRQGRLAARLCA